MTNIYFDETLILSDLFGKSSEEILQAMAANLYDKGLVKESYPAAIIDREKTFATGLPTKSFGVAIPHTDIEHVCKPAISLGILKEEVNFGIMGEESAAVPVKLVFMLAMKESHAQLELLQNLMQIFQDDATLNHLAKETSKIKIRELVSQKLSLGEVNP